jgi:hypothetical protein
MKNQSDTQKQWVNEQKYEKSLNNQSEAEEEKYRKPDGNFAYRAYADQTLAMNRMRGMLEDEMTEKRNQKLKEMQLENKRLALEKKQREQRWRQDQEY